MENKETKKFAILNGHVIDCSSGLNGKLNIIIDNGKIVEIGVARPEEPSFKIIDAEDLVVTPGFIDLHTHLREPGFEYKEDIRSGSKAAVAGGFTSILCMPNTNPVIDCVEIIQQINNRAKDVALAKIYPIGAITKGLGGDKLTNLPRLAKEGVIAISDDGKSVQSLEVMRKAMETAKKTGIVVISHPEDSSISSNGVINEGRLSKRYNLPGIPKEAENTIIERDIALCKKTGARLHIAHVSTKEGISYVREAKSEGIPVTCEVTPHHLTLTEKVVQEIGPMAKMNPPLRTEEDRLALIEALKDGTVDAIATDHAPHAPNEKIDLKTAAFGVIGMETALPVCMKLVEDREITLERLIELFTSGPAKVAGLPTGIVSGGVADITIINPIEDYRLDSSRFRSKSRNTPFHGWHVKGRVRYTMVDGRIVYQAG